MEKDKETLINTTIGDLEVLGSYVRGKGKRGSRKYFTVRCKVCGRTKEVVKSQLVRRLGISHQACSNAVAPADPRFYRIWQALRSRTTLEKTQARNPSYIGISSEDYKYFIDFYDDFWIPYLEHVNLHGEKNTSIDRIDSRGDYVKGNMRWATSKVQNENKADKKTCIGVDPTGKEYEFTSQTDFAKEHDLTKSGINGCLTGYRKTSKKWTFSYKV